MSGLPDKENLRTNEVAGYLNCSTRHVRDLVYEGELEGFYIGSELRIKRQSVLDFEAK